MELSVTLLEPQKRAELFGPADRFLREIRKAFNVRIEARHTALRLIGEPSDVAKAASVLEKLQKTLKSRAFLDEDAIAQALADIDLKEARRDPTTLSGFMRDNVVRPRTEGQKHYIEAMLNNDMVFCLGPAGTGKTYLAVAVACHLLKLGQIKRIALVRPAVEAGEKLGFLPGDLQQKVNPYLRPLFDAMHDMMTYDQLKRFMVSDIVEVIPLAFMRGRTLNNSVIILDEAQNTTPSQMLMFLTRMGNDSKMIIVGDDSQVDLEPGQNSGLTDAVGRLRNCKGLDIVRLKKADIVRHTLVQQIVRRYESSGYSVEKRQETTDNN